MLQRIGLRLGAAVGAAGVAVAGSISVLDVESETSERIYRQLVRPALKLIDAESAHRAGVLASRFELTPKQRKPDQAVLRTSLWGHTLDNPIGLAAGFDKDAEAVPGLLAIGFGMVEVGSITPLPQPGNPRPRVFRLEEDRAVINRYGFNSLGHAVADVQLKAAAARVPQGRLLGVNLGKNKTSEDAAADYCAGVRALGRHAGYIVINVSSPNTPGLRNLQGKTQLSALLQAVRAEVDSLPLPRPPLVLKIAPDVTHAERVDIASVALAERVDGIIVSNTTVTRPASLSSPHKAEAGGLSGSPLKELSTEVLRDMYRLTKGKVALVGVGGVSSGADAYAKIRAGASAVQIYTAMAFEGPTIVPRIKRELASLLEADGFKSVDEAVGADERAHVNSRSSRWW